MGGCHIHRVALCSQLKIAVGGGTPRTICRCAQDRLANAASNETGLAYRRHLIGTGRPLAQPSDGVLGLACTALHRLELSAHRTPGHCHLMLRLACTLKESSA
mmetsp:Transcript_13931/g.36136  ORF Transcript_13931/g.36136 Transcript_13931/m.36136 type:complete len:103 (+) Transcript_13931:408-716(+)